MINKFAGRCGSCRGAVAAQAGQAINHGSGWQTFHNQCVPVRKAPPVGTHQGWHRLPLAAFDLEATLSDPMEARIVSAALVLPDGTRRTWLVNPGVPIPADATELHGITDEMVREQGMPPEVAVAEIAHLVAEQISSATPLVAFYASYDITTLHTELARLGLPRMNWDNSTVIDPLILHKQVEPNWYDSKRLADLCRYYEVELAQAHDALADGLAALGLARSIAARHPRIAQMPVDVLHKHQVQWHFDQATDLQRYFDRVGKGETVSTEWPLETKPR
ncbi:exonuclease domain-containing protein [Solwaraspora sp. WMMB762]|uniref:exonuclease domain-containing protein n=1 Tax=Solwaraspora sp. WMMB762 TaxID=3404120 RepID=UPI003B967496